MLSRSEKILIVSVIGLIMLRIILLFVIYYLPQLHFENVVYTKHFPAFVTGDDKGYYALAEMIYRFDFKEHPYTLGFPLLIAPFIFIFGHGFFNIFFPLVIFNSIFLYSAAIILIFWTSYLIFKKIMPAVISGLFFVLYPFLFYVFRDIGPHFRIGNWNDFNFFHMNWLTAMSDPLSALLIYLIFFLLICSLKKEKTNFYYILLGLLTGYAMTVRISNIIIAAAVALVLLIFANAKFRGLFIYTVSAVIGFLPQFLYNAAFLGSPIKFVYTGIYQDWLTMSYFKPPPIFGLGNLFHLFSRASSYSLLAIPAFLVIGFIIFLGVFYLSKIGRKIALIIALWFFLPTIFYLVFVTGQTTMRYYMPAVPAFIILFVAALWLVLDWLNLKFIRHKIN